MRYYLDTNILVFLLWGDKDEISADTAALLADESNLMLTSTVCVHEIIHLFQIGKLPIKRNGKKANVTEIGRWLDYMGIEVKPVTMKHLETLANLPLFKDHRDPNDRHIVAQDISDHIPLVSSDSKFGKYVRLEFVYNER